MFDKQAQELIREVVLGSEDKELGLLLVFLYPFEDLMVV